MGLDVWFLVAYFQTLCVQIAQALLRLHGCAGSSERSLVAYVTNTIISWADSFTFQFWLAKYQTGPGNPAVWNVDLIISNIFTALCVVMALTSSVLNPICIHSAFRNVVFYLDCRRALFSSVRSNIFLPSCILCCFKYRIMSACLSKIWSVKFSSLEWK